MNRDFNPAAVIFDMDGVMLDTERIYRHAWSHAMAQLGYVLPDELYFRIMGKTVSEIQTVFRKDFGPDVPFEAIVGLKQQQVEAAFSEKGIPVKAGLTDFLDRLDHWRLPRAVASSTARKQVVEMLSRSGVAHRFEVIVGGDEVLRSKPAPDLFLAAAERLAAPAGGCMVLEDSEAGIRAARAAGMHSILIPDLLAPPEEISRLASAVMPSLDNACKYLQVLGGFPDFRS